MCVKIFKDEKKCSIFFGGLRDIIKPESVIVATEFIIDLEGLISGNIFVRVPRCS